MSLNRADSEKLDALQHECDLCKEAIVHEHDVPVREKMQEVCEVCQRVRTRLPDLIALRHKMQEFNAKQEK